MPARFPGVSGLESGRFYMTGCKDHTTDLAIARNFQFGGARQLQFRLELFNAFNTVVYNSRVSTVQFNSPTDQTVRNSQFLPTARSIRPDCSRETPGSAR